MPQHELATDGPPPEAPETSNLMQLRFPDLSRHPVEITWDVKTGELAHQVAALMKQADRIANYVQSLPTRAEYDETYFASLADIIALQTDVVALQTQVGMLFDENRALRQDIQALMLRRAG